MFVKVIQKCIAKISGKYFLKFKILEINYKHFPHLVKTKTFKDKV